MSHNVTQVRGFIFPFYVGWHSGAVVSTVASRIGGPEFESTIWAFLCGVWAVGGATQTQRGGVRGVRLTGDFKLVVLSFQGVP